MRGKGRDQLPVVNSDTFIESHPFPSPCGEKVGINDIPEGAVITWGKGFPSPCGEKVGINAAMARSSSGLWYGVSVPLRGKGRDQLKNALKLSPDQLRFPSPCGEKVGINRSIQAALLEAQAGFRPLAGKR